MGIVGVPNPFNCWDNGSDGLNIVAINVVKVYYGWKKTAMFEFGAMINFVIFIVDLITFFTFFAHRTSKVLSTFQHSVPCNNHCLTLLFGQMF